MGQEMTGLKIPKRLFAIGDVCCKQAGRFVFHAFRLWSETDRVCVEATDGRILVRASVGGFEAAASQEHLPEPMLLARHCCPIVLLGGLAGDVALRSDATRVEIQRPEMTLSIPCVDGTYPDTQAVWRDAAKRDPKDEARGFGLGLLPRLLRVMQRMTGAGPSVGFSWRDGGSSGPTRVGLDGDEVTAEALIMPVRMEA